eukprot:4747541-Prymnesium_polylepis.2
MGGERAAAAWLSVCEGRMTRTIGRRGHPGSDAESLGAEGGTSTGRFDDRAGAPHVLALSLRRPGSRQGHHVRSRSLFYHLELGSPPVLRRDGFAAVARAAVALPHGAKLGVLPYEGQTGVT